jgi:hypothetical protein
LAIIVKKLLNIFAALPNCQSTGGVSIEMAKPIQAVKLEIWQRRVWVYSFISPRLLDSVFVSLNKKK